VIIIVEKELRRLSVLQEKSPEPVCSFPVSLGFSPVGKKTAEGDGKTPEGIYHIAVKNPKSKYYLSLGLDYPNYEDAIAAFRNGKIGINEYREILNAHKNGSLPPQKTALGGEIYIHGGGCGGDWTKGCIALSNPDMLRLFELTPIGTQVTIVP
jgi:murein L,D-transpeptidase YafK